VEEEESVSERLEEGASLVSSSDEKKLFS
jgi:hypothetical protein